MCCYNNPKEVKKVLETEGDVIVGYKRLEILSPTVLQSPYQYYEYHKGINKANFCYWQRPRLNKSKRVSINNGIHVYRELAQAKKVMNCIEIIVKVTALKSDLLGVGKHDMVFKKVTISPQMWTVALKQAAEIDKKRKEGTL